MSAAVERLVSRYEDGKMTRRDLVQALSVLVVGWSATPTAQLSRIPVRALDHVTLNVSDVDRSVEFYQRVFEMPVMSRLGPDVNLAAGSSCLGLHQVGDQDPHINHYCLGIEGFDPAQILKRLADHGVRGSVNDDETPILVFTDPDGILVQLQDENYCRSLGGLEP